MNRSCTLCRKRKVRCDRESPCSACVRTGCTPCIYESHSSVPSRHHRGRNDLRPMPNTLSSVPTNGQPARINQTLRVSSYSPTSDSLGAPYSTSQSSHHKLNVGISSPRPDGEQVKNTRRPAQGFVLTETSRIKISAADISAKSTAPQKNNSDDVLDVTNHILYKTRLFGRSHWMNGATQVSV